MNTKFFLKAGAFALTATVFPAQALLLGTNGDASNFDALDVIEFETSGPNAGSPTGTNNQAIRYNDFGGSGIGLTVGGVAPGVSIVQRLQDGDTQSSSFTRYELSGTADAFAAPGAAFNNFQPAVGVTANGADGFNFEPYNGDGMSGGLPVQIETDLSVAPGGADGNTTLRGFGTQDNIFSANDDLVASYGPITIVFDSPVSTVRGLVGSLSTAGSVRLIAYGNDGSIIGVVSSDSNGDNSIDGLDDVEMGANGDSGISSEAFSTTQGDAAFGLLSLSDLDNNDTIRAVAFYQTAADRQGFGLRGLSFQDNVVPVPASILVMAGGLLLLRRRKMAS